MIRVTTEFGGAPGTPYYSTLYWTGDTQAAADAATSAVNTFWEGLDNLIHIDTTWNVNDEVDIVDVATGQTIGIHAVNGLAGSGEATSEPLPPAVQGLLRWRTGVFLAGREVRGRTFIPSPTEGSNTDGVPAATYITPANAAADALVGAGGTDTNFVIWSPTHGVSPAVISANLWLQWAQLRSRRD